jgi:hypothetical protein
VLPAAFEPPCPGGAEVGEDGLHAAKKNASPTLRQASRDLVI